MLQSETFSVISKHCISNTNNSNDSTYWSVSHWDSSTRRAYSPFASVSLLPVHSEWTLTSVVSSLVLRSPFVDPKSPRKSNKIDQQNYEKHFCSSRCYFFSHTGQWGRQSRQIGTKNFLSYWPKNGEKTTWKIKLEVSFDLFLKSWLTLHDKC